MRADSTQEKPRKRRTLGTVIFVAVIAVIAIFAFSSSWIDTLGQQWVDCEVTSAHATQGNNRSVTPWRVEFQTADCGNISYLKAFTEQEAQSLAAEIHPGTVYEFKLGVLSRIASKSPLKVSTPSAKDLRIINRSKT